MSEQQAMNTPRNNEEHIEGHVEVRQGHVEVRQGHVEGQRVPPSQEYAHYLSKRRHALDQYREKSKKRQKFRKLFEDAIYNDTTTYQLNF
jgi:hypothetical protein